MRHRLVFLVATAFMGLVMAVVGGESPIVITAFGPNGELTWSNSEPGIVSFRLEWAASLPGAWTHDWSSFRDIPNSQTNYTVALPSFYRVVGQLRPTRNASPETEPAPTPTDATASPRPLAGDIVLSWADLVNELTWLNRLPGVAKFRIEWATSPGGPWLRDWASLTGIEGPGPTHTVTLPTHFQIVATMEGGMVPYSGMSAVPPGTFGRGDTAGGGEADESPIWQMVLSPFLIDNYEVSNQQMCDMMQWAYTNERISETVAASWYKNNDGLQKPLFSLADPKCDLTFSNDTFSVKPNREDFPFAAATWYGAAAYGNYRSEIEGFEPCVDFDDWSCRHTNTGWRLPTEVEWEKAARGASTVSQYTWFSPFGSWAQYIDGSQANYDLSGDPHETGPTPLGYYDGNQSPAGIDMGNTYGLYDMAGNAYEWCWDWYQATWYSDAASREPNTPGPTNGTVRALRGGSWLTGAKALRNSARASADPAGAGFATYGFRCVRSLYPLQQVYDAYFAAHPDVADATIGSYPASDVMLQSRFWECLDELERTGAIQMGKPVQLINCASNTSVINLNEEERRRCIAAHHAHGVWLDKNDLLPWSLDDYSTNDLAGLFSNRAVFNNTYGGAAYATVVDYSPSEAFGYLVDQGLIGSNRSSTVCLVLDDLRADFRHVGSWDTWEEKRPLTLLETLTNTFADVNYTHPVRISRSGCHSMARITLAMLRVVNIPGEVVTDGSWYDDLHSSAVWPYLERVMPHGDDIYTSTQEDVPSDEFLVPFQFYSDSMGLAPCGSNTTCMSYRYRVLKDIDYPSPDTSFHVCNATWWGYVDGEDYLTQEFGMYLTYEELTNMVTVFEATCD